MNVLIYTRVSTDEQAEKGYSLRDQRVKLERYCTERTFTIVRHFEDDCSAKTFDRPEFQKLLSFVKKEKSVQKLLVVKFDRFTRNMRLGLNMIAELASYGVTLEAIEQPLDADVPENLLMQAIYLAAPQVENQRRSLNTTNGMRRAMKEGRYVSSAPHGYKNIRDENNKPIIIPDERKSPLIKTAFEKFATGKFSQAEIRKELRKSGLPLSRSRLASLLQNPIYCGLLQIPAFKSEPAEIVKAIHEPIISEQVFFTVQDILKGKKRNSQKKYTKVHSELPLRGFLYCNSHDHKMTGSCSHGRNELYHYYHCDNAIKCERHRAEEVNNSFVEFLKDIKIEKSFIADFKEIFYHYVKPDTSSLSPIKSKITVQEQRLQVLQDKFIDGIISSDDYKQIRARYEKELFDLRNKISIIEDFTKEFSDNFENSFKLLTDLPEFYSSATIEGKRYLIGSICMDKIYFSENKCRTANLNPFIELISSTGKDFRGKNELNKGAILQLVPCGDPAGTQSRTISLIQGVRLLGDCLKKVA